MIYLNGPRDVVRLSVLVSLEENMECCILNFRISFRWPNFLTAVSVLDSTQQSFEGS